MNSGMKDLTFSEALAVHKKILERDLYWKQSEWYDRAHPSQRHYLDSDIPAQQERIGFLE